MWEIRAAEPGDAAPVLALWRLAEAPPTLTDNEPAIRRLVARDGRALLVAIEDNQVVGSIIAGWDGWRGNLYRLVVAPASRRRGLGLALVREAEQRLATLGAVRVNAQVIAADERAMGFWRAAGYHPHEGMTRMIREVDAA